LVGVGKSGCYRGRVGIGHLENLWEGSRDKGNCSVERSTEVGKAKLLAVVVMADMLVGVFAGLCCYEYDLIWALSLLGKWMC
jgi:hypothetical protein